MPPRCATASRAAGIDAALASDSSPRLWHAERANVAAHKHAPEASSWTTGSRAPVVGFLLVILLLFSLHWPFAQDRLRALLGRQIAWLMVKGSRKSANLDSDQVPTDHFECRPGSMPLCPRTLRSRG